MARFPKTYGERVQSLRVPTGFLLLACFALLAQPTTASIWQSSPLIFAGLAVRAWAAGHLEKDRALADSGPYAFTRNPLYLGTFIVALGFEFAGNSWILALLFLAAFILIYLPVMEREEEHLTRIFPGYADYARRVPLLLPRLGPSGEKSFRLAVYLKNEEYKAALAVLAGLCVLIARLSLKLS